MPALALFTYKTERLKKDRPASFIHWFEFGVIERRGCHKGGVPSTVLQNEFVRRYGADSGVGLSCCRSLSVPAFTTKAEEAAAAAAAAKMGDEQRGVELPPPLPMLPPLLPLGLGVKRAAGDGVRCLRGVNTPQDAGASQSGVDAPSLKKLSTPLSFEHSGASGGRRSPGRSSINTSTPFPRKRCPIPCRCLTGGGRPTNSSPRASSLSFAGLHSTPLFRGVCGGLFSFSSVAFLAAATATSGLPPRSIHSIRLAR